MKYSTYIIQKSKEQRTLSWLAISQGKSMKQRQKEKKQKHREHILATLTAQNLFDLAKACLFTNIHYLQINMQPPDWWKSREKWTGRLQKFPASGFHSCSPAFTRTVLLPPSPLSLSPSLSLSLSLSLFMGKFWHAIVQYYHHERYWFEKNKYIKY